MVGSSCISPNRITLSTTLDIPFESFLDKMDDLVDWLVEKVNRYRDQSTTAFDKKNIVIKKLKSGSVVVDSVLSMSSSVGLSGVASGLSQ